MVIGGVDCFDNSSNNDIINYNTSNIDIYITNTFPAS